MTMTNEVDPQSASTNDLSIEGLTEPTVLRYFETMNAGEYEATVSLFTPTGVLHPPFEKPIVGREAIASYLETEAKGMLLAPRQGIGETLSDDQKQFQVTGKVNTPVFAVNVSWIFVLTPEGEILSARIKLLASPQELLGLRR